MKPCADCGGTFHPCAMDFDHVRGEKVVNLSLIARYSSAAALVSEVKKCDLVCSNCHRIRTAQRNNWKPPMALSEITDILSQRKKWYDREAWIEVFELLGAPPPPLPPKPKRGSRSVRKVGPPGTSWCQTHKEFAPIDRFERNASRWNGLQGQCIDCRRKMPSRAPKKIEGGIARRAKYAIPIQGELSL